MQDQKVIEKLLEGKDFSEIVESNKIERHGEELDNRSVKPGDDLPGLKKESRNNDNAIHSNLIVTNDIQSKKCSSQLFDIFSPPKESNFEIKRKETKTKSLNIGTKFDAIDTKLNLGPDGLPQWIPVEPDDISTRSLKVTELSSTEGMEVF